MLKDIFPGINYGVGNPYPVELNGNVIFSGYEPLTGYEPYVTNGTVNGTYQLKDINPGQNPSVPYYFIKCNNRCIFQQMILHTVLNYGQQTVPYQVHQW
ncbi:MAG: hypothetical protein IPP71_19670 [Bacteroidetes bacterium]|nr:hypothetical protein [Bacteroidota bacterium]